MLKVSLELEFWFIYKQHSDIRTCTAFKLRCHQRARGSKAVRIAGGHETLPVCPERLGQSTPQSWQILQL